MAGSSFKHSVNRLIFIIYFTGILLTNGNLFARSSYKPFSQDSIVNRIQTSIPLLKFPELLWSSFRKGFPTNKPEWGKIFVSTQYLFFLSAMDLDIKQWTARNHTQFLDHYFQTVNYFGDRKSALVAAAFGGGSYILGYQEGLDIGMELLVTYGVASFFTHSLKNITGRSRPFISDSQYRFEGPGIQDFRHRSFPSGHATIAFSTATVLNQHIQNKWLRYAIWLLAGSTSIGRVYKEKHWMSDVVAGGLIGYFSARMVVSLSRQLNLKLSQK